MGKGKAEREEARENGSEKNHFGGQSASSFVTPGLSGEKREHAFDLHKQKLADDLKAQFVQPAEPCNNAFDVRGLRNALSCPICFRELATET